MGCQNAAALKDPKIKHETQNIYIIAFYGLYLTEQILLIVWQGAVIIYIGRAAWVVQL